MTMIMSRSRGLITHITQMRPDSLFFQIVFHVSQLQISPHVSSRWVPAKIIKVHGDRPEDEIYRRRVCNPFRKLNNPWPTSSKVSECVCANKTHKEFHSGGIDDDAPAPHAPRSIPSQVTVTETPTALKELQKTATKEG